MYSCVSDDVLCTITDLTVENPENINGISLLKGLRRLSVTGSDIKTVPQEISTLKNIQELDISGTGITDVSFISSLPNLIRLNISECDIKNIDSISNADKLEILYANGLGKSNILNEIGDLSRLRQLSVSGNNIKNIELLQGSSFDYLNVEGNNIDLNALDEGYISEMLGNCKIFLYESQINSLVKSIAVNNNKITAHLYNDTAGKYDKLDVIIAIYEDNKLIECQYATVDDFAGGEETDVIKEFSDDYENNTIKCFVWNSIDSMSPVSMEYQIN